MTDNLLGMIPPEYRWRVYCGQAAGAADGCRIETESVTSAHGDVWDVVRITGSPRQFFWHCLAAQLVATRAAGVLVSFDCRGADLHGLIRLERALRTIDRRGVLAFAHVSEKCFGGAFVAATLFGQLWMDPLAKIGGISGSRRAISEAVPTVARRCKSSRAVERLAAGFVFGAEVAELHGVADIVPSIQCAMVDLSFLTQ